MHAIATAPPWSPPGISPRGQILNARALQASEVRRASLMRGRIPVVPDRASQGRLVQRANHVAQRRVTSTHTRFFSTGRSRPNVARRSFVQQRREMARFVDSVGRSDTRASRPTNARSSADQRRDVLRQV